MFTSLYNGKANTQLTPCYECPVCLECHPNYFLTEDNFEWQIIYDVPVKVNLGGRCDCKEGDGGKHKRGGVGMYETIKGDFLQTERFCDFVSHRKLNQVIVEIPEVLTL